MGAELLTDSMKKKISEIALRTVTLLGIWLLLAIPVMLLWNSLPSVTKIDWGDAVAIQAIIHILKPLNFND